MRKLGKKNQMEHGTFIAYANCGNCNCRNVCITCNNCTGSTLSTTGYQTTQTVNTNKIFQQAASISIMG
ncbi:MAG: CLI_3235 family bacteriocin precursor [Lachnospiraceae bacterium]|nr:CLI_3235 family bacteriocin precursor [Lachnospiraceae bacterium]